MRTRSLLFVGGIYGVGKSALCRILSEEFDASHLKASDLIRFTPRENDPTGKAVDDVDGNQSKLIIALRSRPANERKIILDGHFTVLGPNQRIEPIPTSTFNAIDPKVLLLLVSTPNDIMRKQRERDGKHLDLEMIITLDQAERDHARVVSESLNVPLVTVDASSPETALEASRRAAMESFKE